MEKRRNFVFASVASSLAFLAGCAGPTAPAPLDPFHLAEPKDFSAHRASSNNPDWRSNDDSKRPIPGETTVLADLEGPGVVTHIWMTIADNEYAWPRLLRLPMALIALAVVALTAGGLLLGALLGHGELALQRLHLRAARVLEAPPEFRARADALAGTNLIALDADAASGSGHELLAVTSTITLDASLATGSSHYFSDPLHDAFGAGQVSG